MRTFLLILLSFLCLSSQAQERKHHYSNNLVQARVYLSADSVCSGFLMNPAMHAHYINSPLFSSTDDFVAIKGYNTGLFAKNNKWNEADVDSVVTWFGDEEKAMHMTWLPLKVNLCYAGDSADIPGHRVFMMRLFQGKKVSTYMVFDAIRGQRVVYFVPGMTEAHVIYKAGGKLTDKRRQTLKAEFSAYPEVVSYIDTMNAKDLKADPVSFLKKIDEAMNAK